MLQFTVSSKNHKVDINIANLHERSCLYSRNIRHSKRSHVLGGLVYFITN